MAGPEPDDELEAFLLRAEQVETVYPGGSDFTKSGHQKAFVKEARRQKKPKQPKMPKMPKMRKRDFVKVENKLKVHQQSEKKRKRFRSGFRKVMGGLKAMMASSHQPAALVIKAISTTAALTKTSADPKAYIVADAARVTGIVDYSVWEDIDAHPILLYRDLTRLFRRGWLTWEPETLWQELMNNTEALDIPRETRDKIMALRTAVKTDFPWTQYEIFENTALAFVGKVPRFDVIQQLEPIEVAFALDVLVMIHPGIDLNLEVQKYISATLVDNGMPYAPKRLFGPVQDDIDALNVGDPKIRKGVAAAWGNGRKPDEGKIGADPIETHLATLHAIRDALKGRREELEVTPPLPEMTFDAAEDPTTPGPVPDPVSPQAQRSLVPHAVSV